MTSRPRVIWRLAGVLLVLAIGLFPSVMFFLWVEAQGRDPGMAALIAWVMRGPVFDLIPSVSRNSRSFSRGVDFASFRSRVAARAAATRLGLFMPRATPRGSP